MANLPISLLDQMCGGNKPDTFLIGAHKRKGTEATCRLTSTRSLLKMPFTQRVDHSKKHTLKLSFVVGASDLLPKSA